MDKKEWPAWKKWVVGIGSVVGIGVGAIVAAPICGAVLGIGATGPVAGGAFATAQAAGLVTAGSTYATIQSAVMGGYGVATVATAGAGAGAVVIGGGTTAIVALVPNGKEEKPPNC